MRYNVITNGGYDMRYSFYNDYSEGTHPSIFKALYESNRIQSVRYMDAYCERMKKAIKQMLKYENCDIHFLGDVFKTKNKALIGEAVVV